MANSNGVPFHGKAEGKKSCSGRRKKTFKAGDYLHQVSLSVGKGRRLKIPITASGNRFSVMIVAARLLGVIENQARMWEAQKDVALSPEDMLKVVKALDITAKISYRAYGDSRDTPDLPPVSPAQSMMLRESLPEAYALLNEAQNAPDDHQVDPARALDIIDMEESAAGLTQEDIERAEAGNGK